MSRKKFHLPIIYVTAFILIVLLRLSGRVTSTDDYADPRTGDTEPAADTGAEAGTEPGTGTGAEAGTGTGAEAGTGTGAEAGTDTGTEAGTEAGTDADAGTEADAGGEEDAGTDDEEGTDEESNQPANPAAVQLLTQMLFVQFRNMSTFLGPDIRSKLDFCIKDVDAEWNYAFNFSSDPQFMSNCIQKTKGMNDYTISLAHELTRMGIIPRMEKSVMCFLVLVM
ncbi:uncharacterized protein LOC124925023 [Impatiens glandulifera]|uniref:uncharacterized protein LOC124925023 n=1 Tax=Impatiens glandulifera TaxID=253017 RepID=UPI001FB15D1F|nr:uncharacterized protein LOC124925023 [Impatiens glandulifera]